jgi:hypothetical protein
MMIMSACIKLCTLFLLSLSLSLSLSKHTQHTAYDDTLYDGLNYITKHNNIQSNVTQHNGLNCDTQNKQVTVFTKLSTMGLIVTLSMNKNSY